MSRSPPLAEVLARVLEHRLSTVHVCMPGVIVSYDHTKQTASVQPAIKNVVRSENGEEAIDYPLIPDVPVAHPRAGAWFIHLPLSAGDFVMLHFAERAIDQFRLKGSGKDPLDVRMHDLSDAIAVPCNLAPDANALTGIQADTLSIGLQGGSSLHIKADGTINLGSASPLDAIATANKVATELTALKVALLADAVAAVAASGLYFGAATQTLLNGGWPGSVASTKGKVDP